ncbi:hypothetical protein R3P38DRAFT_496362 [Favolaschia claudopus]|uniref:Uncharacterized protein n=1 Tax=Favolaschia claudopus TaxID=2862362 RepID=A0AAW0CMX9_9AGAR
MCFHNVTFQREPNRSILPCPQATQVFLRCPLPPLSEISTTVSTQLPSSTPQLLNSSSSTTISPSSPPATSQQIQRITSHATHSHSSRPSPKLQPGTIAGAAVGGFFFFICVGAAFLWFRHRRLRIHRQQYLRSGLAGASYINTRTISPFSLLHSTRSNEPRSLDNRKEFLALGPLPSNTQCWKSNPNLKSPPLLIIYPRAETEELPPDINLAASCISNSTTQPRGPATRCEGGHRYVANACERDGSSESGVGMGKRATAGVCLILKCLISHVRLTSSLNSSTGTQCGDTCRLCVF